ncbi:hypothetical protein LCGC14_0461650 [marine sediment metagenome]|uniref:Helicase ATP-binding domain-containing protein n=1 Tax=marine sediment metagenome TaxID=412755 RepID=A0A0F9SXS2_9ZZZZ
MIRLQVEASWVTAPGCPREVAKLIKDQCKARDPQAFFTGGASHFHLWRIREKELQFPTGLLWDVVQQLDAVGIEYEIDPHLGYVVDPELVVPDGIELRDYQEEAVKVALREGRGILGLATNSGKSIIAAALVQSFASHDCVAVPTIVLVVRAEGVRQMTELFRRCFGDDLVANETGEGKSYVIMTYTKASKRDLSPYLLVIADEVHRVGAKTYCGALATAENAYHRYGLSGTPGGREDGKDLYFIGATGPVIYRMPQDALIKRGFSARAAAIMLHIPGDIHPAVEEDIAALVLLQQSGKLSRGNQFKLRKLRAQLWRDVEAEGILENEVRNIAIVDAATQAQQCGRQVLILVKRIDHGRRLRELFAFIGYEVPFAHGNSKGRDKIYTGLQSGEHRIVIGSGIYDDSIDVPNIEVLINAAGGKSLNATKQKLGRGLRNPGDKSLLVIDFMDTGHKILKKHSRARKRAYQQEGVSVRKAESLSEEELAA